MHEAAGAPPQLTNGACAAAQSTGAAPLLEAFSKHGLWRCERTESQQWPTKALISAQRINHHDGRALRKNSQPRAADACSDAAPPCELQTRRRRADG